MRGGRRVAAAGAGKGGEGSRTGVLRLGELRQEDGRAQEHGAAEHAVLCCRWPRVAVCGSVRRAVERRALRKRYGIGAGQGPAARRGGFGAGVPLLQGKLGHKQWAARDEKLFRAFVVPQQ